MINFRLNEVRSIDYIHIDKSHDNHYSITIVVFSMELGMNERKQMIIEWLQEFDQNTFNESIDLREYISDNEIRWLIDYYDLTKHNPKIFGMRYHWEHPFFSKKQRWMVLCSASQSEKQLFE